MSLPPRAQAPIGIFDSGLGGLTVAAAVARALPNEDIVYLGDTARVPYGTRSPATVVRYARKNVSFLRAKGVKLVVVACNTVSAQGLGGLADGSELPLLGVIRPGVRAALEVSRGGAIAVLGTPATIRSNAYEQAIHERVPGRPVVQIPCPLFVPLVEEGWLDHDVTRAVAKEYLGPLADTGVDTIILGCTHYPLLTQVIRETATELLSPDVVIVDSASAVAHSTAILLETTGLVRSAEGGDHRFFVTDAPDRVSSVATRFWDMGDARSFELEHVDLVDFNP